MQRLPDRTVLPAPVSNPARVFGLTSTLAAAGDATKMCTHELFEAQVARTPNAVATVCDNIELRYRELNERANQLAHELVRLGVSENSSVGICLERSPEMIVAVLATLKAGGAYVPLDPTYPQDRLAFMLDDAQVTVLLTQSRFVGTLSSYDGPRFCLDKNWKSIEHNCTDDLTIRVNPDSLAYVIYTSGSTGKPKGAMITHRGLTNYLKYATEAYEVTAGSGALLHSSISFDLTVTSLFAPLMVGRSVFLVPDGIETLAAALTERTDYSLLKITPAHLRALTELLPDDIAGHVRVLIIGGEALHFESLSFWREHSPATRIINEYGPTETVVGCSVYEVSQNDPASGPVPIGKAIQNTQLRVLDESLNEVAIGEVGELFIGGAGVARGYLNRPELTRERFVASPCGGELLYRSGDLARVRADGNLEYLGRVDDQVKVRGYRIELGEIETVLKQHAAVSDCAVIAKDEASGEKRLLAFVAPNQGAAVDDANLVSFLKTKLPEYMVPAAFVQLEALPLTINGKVDRKALTNHSPAPATGVDHAAPRTAIEQELTMIWADVLRVPGVGINDNFFDLGGDSILGTLILARAARAGLKISPSQLFEHQTIAELAAVAAGN